MEIGSIIAFAGSVIPNNFLECNGAAISRTTYPILFSVIGTTYGSGDGSTTFNLPNLSGKAALGSSQTHAVGSTGGSAGHSLLETETPVHTHTIPQHTHENTIKARVSSMSHTVTQPVFQYTRANGSTDGYSGSTTYSGNDIDTMTLYKGLEVADHPATACTVTGGITDCPAFDTESAGSGIAHNNMMPYMAIKYLIQTDEIVPTLPKMLMYNGCYVATNGGGYISETEN